MQPRPLADLTDRQPLDAVHAPDLCPLLHADHTLLLARPHGSSESPDPAGRTRPRAGWATFRTAQVDHYSPGAHMSDPRINACAAPVRIPWSLRPRRRR